MILTYKLDQPLHKLRAPTMILRAIIQIDDQRGNVRKALTDRLPPLGDPIHETITGHFGRDAVHKQFVRRREKDTNGLPTICQPRFVNFLSHLHDWLTTNAAGIIAGAMTQHGHQHTQQSVANIAQGLAMALSLRP